MAAKDYSDDILNYFRVYHVTTSIIPDGLRAVFKQEWDTHYQVSHGTWQDTARNGIDFLNLESLRNQKRNAGLLSLMQNGNTLEWDCTCLFYALLYSDSVGAAVAHNLPVKAAIDDLRQFRNKTFAHIRDGKLKEVDFQDSIQQVITSFTALRLNTTVIEEIKNQTSFPTDEVRYLEQELSKEKKRNEEPKPFCVLPPKPSHASFDRVNEVKETMKEMQRLMDSNANEITVVYLSGNPGCGKSQLARQIGESFFSEVSGGSADVTFVTTLNASTDETLLQSYLDLGTSLGCNEESVTKIGTSKDLTTEEKLNHLRSLVDPRLRRYSSWLIIADNVTKLESVSKYLPNPGDKTLGYGQVLITTQDSQCIPSDDHTYHLSLSTGMHPDDAIETLKCVSKISDDNESILKVAEALDFQPLALACAAVYMRRIRISDASCGWTKYLQKLEEGKRDMTEKAYVKTSKSYPISMTQAVSMAADRDMEDEKAMIYTFQFLSVIAPEPVALEYVVSYVSEFMCDEDEDLLAANICSSSLIICSEKEPKEVRIHQVVRNYLQIIFLDEGTLKEEIFVSTVLAFTSVPSIDNYDTTGLYATRTLVLHFQALAKKIDLYSDSVITHIVKCFSQKYYQFVSCLSTIGHICEIHGHFVASKIYFKVNLAVAKSVYGENNLEVAVRLFELGTILHDIGQNVEAKACFERTLAINENEYGEEHPKVASTLTNLANTLRELGQYQEAKACFKKTLAIKENEYGEEHPEVAGTLVNLATTLHASGEYAESKASLERALLIFESVYGEKDPRVADALHNLGITLESLGQYTEAKACMERALVIKKSAYGEKHPKVAHTLISLGSILFVLNQYAESKASLEGALSIYESVNDGKHPNLGVILTRLGITLHTLRQYTEAEGCLRRALTIRESLYGEDHRKLAVTLTYLGNTLRELGQYAEAKACLERALTIEENEYGEEHPEVAGTLVNLGATLHASGEYAESKASLERALLIFESVYGEKDPLVADALHNLGITLESLGQYTEAKACIERALVIKKSAYGEKHPKVAHILISLGSILFVLNQYAESKASLEGALSIYESVNDGKHPNLGVLLTKLGITLHTLRQYTEAEGCLRRALTIRESLYGEDHRKLAVTLTYLGNTLRELGQYAEAKACLKRAMTIKENE